MLQLFSDRCSHLLRKLIELGLLLLLWEGSTAGSGDRGSGSSGTPLPNLLGVNAASAQA